MDFLMGNPFVTKVGLRIEQATSSTLQSEDWGLNMEICDIVNGTDEGPKDAVRAIKKRIVGNKNFKEVMFTLTVLEACVKNCGHRFHVLVSSREFVEGVLVRTILPKNNPPMVVQDRVLCLIQAWADAFRSSPSLTGVVSVYEDLRRKGLEFPTARSDTISPIHTPDRTVMDSETPGCVLAPPPGPHPDPVSPQYRTSVQVDGPLFASPDQLRAELEVVRGNLALMTDTMSHIEPGGAKTSDTELLQQLYSVCKGMQDRVMELIPQVTDEKLIEELLVVNDDLNSAFSLYLRLQTSLYEQDTTEQTPDSTYANLIDLSPAPHRLHQSTEAAAQSEVSISQSTVNSLSTQMATLSAQDGDEFVAFAQSRRDVQAGQKESLQHVSTGHPDAEEMPVSQATVMDDIEKWLGGDGADEGADSEGVTSEEFDRFLEERAKAADLLPSIQQTNKD